MARLSVGLRSELRFIAFFLANRTVCLDVLPFTVDYSAIFSEPSALEQALAIWANVLDLDETGMPTNADLAKRRMAQYIRSYVDAEYTVEPPLDEWELDLPL